MRIGNIQVGPGQPVFIIAEAGVNHNGEIGLAKRLIDLAKEANVDAVKFQTWVTEKIVAPNAPMAEYQTKNVGQGMTQFEMLKQLELSYNQFRELKSYADQSRIMFCSTPDEEDSSDFLDTLDVPFFKIGSAEVTSLPFLSHIASKNKPIILSTGMSSLGEVEAAVRTIERAGNNQLILLHCVSNYPADPADCNLRAIDTMSQAFGYPVGYSDHTMGNEVALAAVARGACVIEKHFTLDRSMPGPDHLASADPVELKELVNAIRKVESALGDGLKRPSASELETKKVVQKGIVTVRSIQAGETLSRTDLTLLRTFGGLDSSKLGSIVGRQVNRELKAYETITLEMLR